MRFTSWTNKRMKPKGRDLLKRIYINYDAMKGSGLQAFLGENLSGEFVLSVVDMKGARRMNPITEQFHDEIMEHMEELGIENATFEELFERFDEQAKQTYGE